MLWRRSLALLATCVSGCMAADSPVDMASGIFRGSLMAIEGTAAAGQLNARGADGIAYTCGYDSRTYIELEKWRVTAIKLRSGDSIEVLADRRAGSRNCYVRTIHVLPPPQPPRRPSNVKAPSPSSRPSEPLRGDRTVSGIIIQHQGNQLTLRTREGEMSLILRPDTRYVGEGLRLGPSSLAVNTHVFVRAGQNLYGQIEAYQVMWGEILNPLP